MSLLLYAHPFSSYCQKVLIALYESNIPFSLRILSAENPEAAAQLEALWPLKRFPLLVADKIAIPESTIIIEYLALRHPSAARLIPGQAQNALDVRLMDRFFDNYIMTPMMKIVSDFVRLPAQRDGQGVIEARSILDTAYRWLNSRMVEREWASGNDFSLADCAGAPALFYADWTHPIPDSYAALRKYRQHLLARPSFARAVDEARHYRSLFPLGAPARD
jgi:glutathione S-transferase